MGHSTNYFTEVHCIHRAIECLRPYILLLEVMEKGIHIYIFYKGKKYIYKVKEKIYTDVNDPKLYDFSPGEQLTLITFSMGYHCLHKKTNGYHCLSAIDSDNLSFKW